MAGQERVQKPRKTSAEAEDVGTVSSTRPVSGKPDAAALSAEMDSILDEIDAVLEENAEEFVNAYVQKGGE